MCWTNTKAFHNFYKRVEQLQKNYWDSIEVVSDEPDETVCVDSNSCSDAIKREQHDSLNNVANVVKYEEMEPTVEVIDIQISQDNNSEYNDDNSCNESNFRLNFAISYSSEQN